MKNVMKTPVIKLVAMAMMVCVIFAGCGKDVANAYEGVWTFETQHGSKKQVKTYSYMLTIEKDGTCTMNKKYPGFNKDFEGTWTKGDNDTIVLDFDGEFSDCEPLICKVTNTNASMTVSSDNPKWTTDIYTKR